MSTVLIVGASRGIGLEFARQYVTDGARVIATHRAPEAAAKLRDLGAKPLALDVQDEGAVADFGDKMAQEKLDIVVINAGVVGRAAAPSNRGALDFDAVIPQRARSHAVDPCLGAGADRSARQACGAVEPNGDGIADDEQLQLAVPH